MLPERGKLELRRPGVYARPGLDLRWAGIKAVFCDLDDTAVEFDSTHAVSVVVGDMHGDPTLADRMYDIEEEIRTGEIPFDKGFATCVEMVAGVPVTLLDGVADAAAATATPGVHELLGKARSLGAYTMILSGGMKPVVERVAARLGFDSAHGSEVEVRDGLLTGALIRPCDGAEKARMLREKCRELGIDPSEAMMLGDSRVDLEAMELAGVAVGVCPKPVVREVADIVVDKRTLFPLFELFT